MMTIKLNNFLAKLNVKTNEIVEKIRYEINLSILKCLPKKIQNKALFLMYDQYEIDELIKNKKFMDILYMNKNDSIRMRVASNGYHLHKLYQDESCAVRMAVAKKTISVIELDILSKDENIMVKYLAKRRKKELELL